MYGCIKNIITIRVSSMEISTFIYLIDLCASIKNICIILGCACVMFIWMSLYHDNKVRYLNQIVITIVTCIFIGTFIPNTASIAMKGLEVLDSKKELTIIEKEQQKYLMDKISRKIIEK